MKASLSLKQSSAVRELMSMSLESFNVSFNDFPDEILLMIFQWLNSIDVLYSFHNFNSRFNRIVRDPIISRRLNFVEKIYNHYHSRIRSNEMLNRLCSEILPSIADQIDQFDLGSSMQEILGSVQYPNLSQLSLHDVKRETIEWLFKDEKLSSGIFQNSIQTLRIRIDETDVDESSSTMSYICENLFIVFHSLINLELDESLFYVIGGLSFHENRLDHFISSTLLKLKINVSSFEDALYLFDGRFNQLESVDLNVNDICSLESIRNEGRLPHMKHFSICCLRETIFENVVFSLLKRMSNLEKLKICLKVSLSQGFLDMNYFYSNVICSLRKLNLLSLYIRSRRIFPNQVDLSILQTLEEVFNVNPNVGITAYRDYFLGNKCAQYHLYSTPSFNEYFCGISNRFPGGKFPYVRRISLIDEKPFEYEFFLRIAQSFPQMMKLSITNSQAQNHRQSNDDQRNLFPIKYDNLIRLMLINTHDHYLEQFLLNAESIVLHKLTLFVQYQSLKRVTNNFTRDQTQLNSSKVNYLFLCDDYEHSDNLQEYFPYAIIEP